MWSRLSAKVKQLVDMPVIGGYFETSDSRTIYSAEFGMVKWGFALHGVRTRWKDGVIVSPE